MLHQYNLLSKELQQEVQHYIEYLFLKNKTLSKKTDEESIKETQADKISDTELFGINTEMVSDKKLFEVSNHLIKEKCSYENTETLELTDVQFYDNNSQ
ncbi:MULTISPECIES: hypothetical protein [Treponema]|uniref:Uncharacterized protein n=1 Tax=Treponema denticola (strain ATCC 35405 / DSM 14222 / CIP 103919 / JCM 8153 / KCTC 15104) TaxID=243275 RepID=Q73JQ6_TREDE|nr:MULTISPECIES: hypothetical protein [Treponema]AAS12970.1 hypothetical protein TDE_2452 [Treponema denticola ATCC 35405]EMB38103.1 hypothetical protein HMPREF9721_01120 [Treponema denticola ATCC 35404]EMB40045.1 hypothetical protein HMPREF9735_00709 [Treponema denticola ATCC 33521]HCY95461.1 hypothetical protein [Treponema sp.]